MTYLSIAPEGLREAFITGGLSPIGRPGRRRLRRDLSASSSSANRRYFERYPDDRARVRRHPAPPRRRGRPAADRRPPDRAPVPPARHVARRQRRVRAPPPRRRAAIRVERVPGRRRGGRPVRPQPHLRHAARVVVRGRRRHPLVRRIGCCPTRSRRRATSPAEHVFPWMWEDYGGLRPQREAAEILAEHEWPALYDADQLAPQRGPGRGDDLRQRPLRRARLCRGDRGDDPRAPNLADRRVRAQRVCAPTASASSAG